MGFVVIQYDRLNINRAIYEEMGYQTINGAPESTAIHVLRWIFQILGIVVTIFSFLVVCGFILFTITVGVLNREGNLGEASFMNRSNQQLVRSLKKFPFGRLLFKEATECAICLDTFHSKVEIV